MSDPNRNECSYSEKPNNSDLISRQALLEEYDRIHIGPPGKARELIENAHTIEERKKGKWIYPYETTTLVSICSECGAHGRGNFCPTCGADMRGEQDG